MEARKISLPNAVQYSFELPHQILTSAAYPYISDDGTTCVVYGHAGGLRVLWITSKNATDVDDGSVEDEESKEDATPSFVDIPLDKPVTHISCPVAIPSITHAPFGAIGRYLRDHVVIGVACMDNSTYLVSCSAVLPNDGSTVAGLSVLPVSQANAHGSLISSISLTWTLLGDDFPDNESIPSRPRNRTADADNTRTEDMATDEWAFVFATASSTGSGLLLVHSVPVPHQVQSYDGFHDTLLHRQSLNAPLGGCSIRFSPAIYPSSKHTTLSITIPTEGMVKIVDVSGQHHTPSKKRLRNESSDAISASAQPRITLRTDFIENKDDSEQARRAQILDAAWIMDGGALLVLLENGQFGIWDIDAVGPTSNLGSKGLIKGESNISGISGGSTTRFALRSVVPDSSVSHGSHILSKGQTPTKQLCTKRGTVNVCSALQPVGNAKIRHHVILHYNEELYCIADMYKFWQAELHQKSINTSRLLHLPLFICGDNPVNSITALSTGENGGTAGYLNGAAGLPDLIICTAHHVLILRQRITQNSTASLGRPSLLLRLNPGAGQLSRSNLFANHELDINAMDEALNNMGASQTAHEMATSKVTQDSKLFTQSRTDRTPNSPLGTRNSRSKLNITSQGQKDHFFR